MKCNRKSSRYTLALDQGTTSSRAILFDAHGNIVSLAQKEFRQIYPRPGWVEHNPLEIWQTQFLVAREAIESAGVGAKDIAAIGITNQRETVVAWDRSTGKPLGNAIVWQDRRTTDRCRQLQEQGLAPMLRKKTGLVTDPYFSATKMEWILKNGKEARLSARRGSLAFGTIDSWLVWNLTGGRLHLTDASNASRTMLFQLKSGTWDKDLLELFGIPLSSLPEIVPSSCVYGETDLFGAPIPISGIAGDQQAALFGQACTQPGMVKNTYGTGCFLLMHTGDKPVFSKNQLLSTVAWKIGDRTEYALEGSVFIAGALVQWLRDGLGIIRSSSEIESLARQVQESQGLSIVPAFAGLGAPHWDPTARGLIIGITGGTRPAHIARAALEAIAHQVTDVVEAMEKDAGIPLRQLRADGGASVNGLLLQLQSSFLGVPVIRPKVSETTALGAAYLAGLAVGYWKNISEISSLWQKDAEFRPVLKKVDREKMRNEWKRALERSKAWALSKN